MILFLSLLLDGVWINQNPNSKLTFIFEKDIYQSTLILNDKLEAKASGHLSFEENKIFFTPTSYKISPLTNAYAQKLNETKFCGLSDWKRGLEVEARDLDCIDQGLDELGRTKPYAFIFESETSIKLNEQRFIRD